MPKKSALAGFFILILVFTQGCAGFEDAQIVVNDLGPAQLFTRSVRQQFMDDRSLNATDLDNLRRTDRITYPNLFGSFVESYKISLADTENTQKGLAMARAGYDLADYYCAQFFQAGGENQKWLNLSKDLVAALGTLATGASALTGATGSTTTVLALATATAYNGIDIYTRNFLFGAANINSVRNLTLGAMAAHRTASVDAAAAPAGAWTFGTAMRKIEEHQAVCQSAAIRDLVLQAINTSKATTQQPGGGGGGTPAPVAAMTVKLN